MKYFKPTAVRESGMPPTDYWRTFFDPASLLEEVAFRKCQRVLELGAGYGLFTLPLASYCQSLTTIEIDGNLCDELRSILLSQKCDNVVVVEGDFTDTQLLTSCGNFDGVVLFNILHMEDPPQLLNCLRSVMSTGCRVYVLHWRTDIETPRGPSLVIRSTPEQCRSWFADCGFSLVRELFPVASPYHFAHVYRLGDTEDEKKILPRSEGDLVNEFSNHTTSQKTCLQK